MQEEKITLRKFFGHLGTVLTHKWWVFYYACKLGIPWRGIIHDLSKFSPTEFWESVRYWTGTKSPIVECKKAKGYSLAWQHHKGRNSHHYEYWVDNLDRGGTAIKMPWKDLLELIADYLGAGRAYQGKGFSLESEYKWWKQKESENIQMHIETQDAVTFLLNFFRDQERVIPVDAFREAYEDGHLNVYNFLGHIYHQSKNCERL